MKKAASHWVTYRLLIDEWQLKLVTNGWIELYVLDGRSGCFGSRLGGGLFRSSRFFRSSRLCRSTFVHVLVAFGVVMTFMALSGWSGIVFNWCWLVAAAAESECGKTNHQQSPR